MADSFLQGAEIGGGLVARAMEQRRQNALLPLQIQEAQDRLHMNALNFEEAQYHRDIEIQTKEGNTAVAAWAAKPHDWGSDQTMSEFVGLTQTHPMAIKSPAGQLAVANMEKARAAKNTLERSIEVQNLIATRVAETEAARAESKRLTEANQLLMKEKDIAGKLAVERERVAGAMARTLARIEAPGKMLPHADLAIFKSKVEALVKSPEAQTWPPAKLQRTIDAMGDELKGKMRPVPKGQEQPAPDENVAPDEAPTAEPSPAAATPPEIPPTDPKKREAGKVYQTRMGPMIWRGKGWEKPSE